MNSDRLSAAANPLLREGLDHISQGITIFDRDLHLVAWNRRFLRLLDFPEDLAFEGADFATFIRYNARQGEYGPGDVETLVAHRVDEARRFAPHRFERERPNGIIVEVAGTPLPGGGFVTVYTDVTEDKHRQRALERRVAERTSALEASEARLHLIANEVPAGIAHVDRDLNILYANRRFARAYGKTPDAIIGLPCSAVLHPRTLRDSARFFEQSRRGALVDFEMNVLLPDGRRKDIRTLLRPDQPSAGEVIGFYLLSIDITRSKAANAALGRAQKMDALGRLSSGISHDFNNLLTIILGNLIPLSEQLDSTDLAQEFLTPAISAARRGSGLTRRLLMLARREPFDPKPVNIAATTDDLVALLRSTMPDDIAIRHVAQGPLPLAFVDHAQFEMALLNMAVNARDAITPPGSITLETALSHLDPAEAEVLKITSGDYVQVRVIDTGSGMTHEQSERIFEPFYTSKAQGSGSGLGLAMVYGFVQQSNGAIRVESEPGKGSTFTLLLPTAVAEDDVDDAPAPRKAPAADLGAAPQEIVLLVDDDADVRRVVRRQLITLGYPLIEAESAAEALDLFARVQGIGYVLTDVAMPGAMNGIGLAEALHDMSPATGIIVMSAHGTDTAPDSRIAATPKLAKPFDLGTLSQALAAADRHRQAPPAGRTEG